MAPMEPNTDDTPAEAGAAPDAQATEATTPETAEAPRTRRTRKATASTKTPRKRAPRKAAASDEATTPPVEEAGNGTTSEAPAAGEAPATTGMSTGDAATETPAGTKRKRPAKKAAVPADAPGVPADAPGETLEEAPAPTRRRRATRQTDTLFSHAGDPVPGDDTEPAPEPEAAPPAAPPVPAASAFGVLFQAPDLSEVPARPARRRAERPQAEPVEGPVTEEAAAPAAPTTEEPDSSQPAGQDESEESASGRRRRRRGGKGRKGRAGGEDQDDQARADEPSGTVEPEADRPRRRGRGGDDTDTQPAAPAADPAAAEGEDDSEPGTRRRRRRRRSGEEGERRDEVTGVKGSTRLEAKRQRRREGREAGRRRTVITEAEFLARRESVERVMVVRGTEERTQIGVLEDGVLVEHYVSRETQSTMVGNVYLGRVQNVLPSMEAAFVDIGKGRNAVLYAGEVNWDAAGLDNEPKRIENALSPGESVLVQVTKDPIGHKGARLTSQISLPGRYLVYVPGNAMTGISRKLPDTERARLKKILKDVVPADAGVIVRTAAEGATEAELRADVERLTGTWERIQAKQKTANAPSLLHGEADMTVRVIRDVFNEDFSKLIVSGDKAWKEISDYIASVAPDLADRLERWTGDEDIFTAYRVNETLAKALDRKVWLPSGGSLVIDRTEAMTVIDVNTGKFVGSGGNLEETVTKNNIEAAEEIVRQLRLRDIGGIIVIDFIDMVLESNRELVIRRLLECLGRDRTKHQVAEVTSLGLVQMTRKRVGSGLLEVFSEPCPHCGGRGIIVHPEPVDKPASEGNGGGRNGGGRGSRRSRGGSQQSAAPTAAVLPPPNPNGPTPAQIAAAAHAAALAAAGESPSQESDAAAPEAPAPETQEAADAAAAVAVETEAPGQGDREQVETAAASVAAAEPAAADTAPAEVVPAPVDAQPATSGRRPRRRRGRVVAPAGPPGSTAVVEAE